MGVILVHNFKKKLIFVNGCKALYWFFSLYHSIRLI
jgi:hypothetical protein